MLKFLYEFLWLMIGNWLAKSICENNDNEKNKIRGELAESYRLTKQ